MLIGYLVRCPRQAWLSLHHLWMEQESDTVALGRLLGATAYSREKKELDLEVEGPGRVRLVGRIDHADLRDGVLHEVKKSPSAHEAHLWQLRFYLWLLRLADVTRADGEPFTGRLDYPALRRTQEVTLDDDDIAHLAALAQRLSALAEAPHPPPRLPERKACFGCSYEELCYG